MTVTLTETEITTLHAIPAHLLAKRALVDAGLDIDRVLDAAIDRTLPPGPTPPFNHWLLECWSVDDIRARRFERAVLKLTDILERLDATVARLGTPVLPDPPPAG